MPSVTASVPRSSKRTCIYRRVDRDFQHPQSAHDDFRAGRATREKIPPGMEFPRLKETMSPAPGHIRILNDAGRVVDDRHCFCPRYEGRVGRVLYPFVTSLMRHKMAFYLPIATNPIARHSSCSNILYYRVVGSSYPHKRNARLHSYFIPHAYQLSDLTFATALTMLFPRGYHPLQSFSTRSDQITTCKQSGVFIHSSAKKGRTKLFLSSAKPPF